MNTHMTKLTAIKILSAAGNEASFLANVVSTFSRSAAKLVALATLVQAGSDVRCPGSFTMPFEGVWVDGYMKTWAELEGSTR